MKPFILLALLIYVSAGMESSAQATLTPIPDGAPTLNCQPRYRKGEEKTFIVTQEHARITPGKPGTTRVSHTEVRLEILAADENGIVVQWVQGATIFDGRLNNRLTELEPLLTMLKEQRLEIQLDANGQLTGLRNLEEIKAGFDKMTEEFLRLAGKADIDPVALELVRSKLKEMFSSPEVLTEAVLRHAKLLFLPVGRIYPYQQPLPFNSELPNFIGGKSIPAQGRFVLTEIDEQKAEGTISWNQIPEDRALKTFLSDSMAQIGRSTGNDTFNPASLSEVQIKDEAQFKVDLNTCWVTYAALERSSRMVAGDQVFKATDGMKLVLSAKPSMKRLPPKASFPPRLQTLKE
jgi:hypothetical protein